MTKSTNSGDTTSATVPAGHGGIGSGAPGFEPDDGNGFRSRRSRILNVISIGLLTVLIIGAIVASLVRLPYYRLSPGSVYESVTRVEAPADKIVIPEEGEIGFVTVSQTAGINVWQWLDARLDSDSIIRHEDEINGTRTTEERREEDQRRMQVSKNDAVVLALQRLGYEIEVVPLGVEIAQVFDCTAADRADLGTGDAIVAVEGEDTLTTEALFEQLADRQVGEELELVIAPIDPNNPTQALAPELRTVTLGSADDECLPDEVRADEPRAFIGISTAQLARESLPFEVNIDSGRVGGPSAGLAFTLAVIDVLSEGELTNGLNIVATGTITRDGQVGAVGGIHQKTVAAEKAGADVFLVPMCCDNFVSRETGEPVETPSNYEEALQHADEMLVIGVDTLDDALAAIGELGGDVDDFLARIDA